MVETHNNSNNSFRRPPIHSDGRTGDCRRVMRIEDVEVIVEPRQVLSWEDFKRSAPPGSIALDGYVKGATLFDEAGPWVNFNHHEGVDRLSTSSTCLQVLLYIKAGFIDHFMNDNKLSLRAYVNDSDQDTCLALWLLANHKRVLKTKSEDSIEKLVYTENCLDIFGGAYPYTLDDKIISELAWIFEPYTESRANIQSMDAGSMAWIIKAVCKRITAFADGHGKMVLPRADYKQISEVFPEIQTAARGWVFVAEEETYARLRLVSDYDAFVSLIGEDNGAFKYTVGKLKSMATFPVKELYEVMNTAEKLKGNNIDDNNNWSGSDKMGGSPRASGSYILPKEILDLVNSFLDYFTQDDYNELRKEFFLRIIVPSIVGIPGPTYLHRQEGRKFN